MRQADKDYEKETATYEYLRKHGITASYAPKYYGSWIFRLSITIGGRLKSRSVKMVLIETLNGTSIQDTRVQNSSDRNGRTDSFHYPEEYRLEVLARAMDGYVKQLKIGLEQGDFAPSFKLVSMLRTHFFLAMSTFRKGKIISGTPMKPTLFGLPICTWFILLSKLYGRIRNTIKGA